MKKVCGVEIKGSEAILAIAEVVDDEIRHVAVDTRKLPLRDDESSEHVKSFVELVRGFARDNGLDQIAIKKRSKKGEFAGGPVTFKIEGLIQSIDDCAVDLISPQTIGAANRKHEFDLPSTLNKYQHEAFLTACASLARGD
jgi:hypothetical protein